MFEQGTDEPQIDIALRLGLRGLPVPQTSPDFDAKVMSAVLQSRPWWRSVVPALRPLFAGAACSTVLTLMLVRWAMQMPEPGRPSADVTMARTSGRSEMASSRSGLLSASASSARIEDALDRTDLTASSLARLSPSRREEPAVKPFSPIGPVKVPRDVRPGQSRLPTAFSSPFV